MCGNCRKKGQSQETPVAIAHKLFQGNILKTENFTCSPDHLHRTTIKGGEKISKLLHMPIEVLFFCF